MRKREGWILIVCIAILIGVLVLEPSYGWKLREWLTPQPIAQSNDPTLAAQNEALKAQLAELQAVASQLPNDPPGYERAMVYSRYPLNFKNEFLVNAGSNQGVAVGKAVVFQGIFVGSVETVYSDSAVVRTVFDSDFKIPVRIGSSGYDALLIGGSYPKATSIEKSAALSAGDVVYTAASGTSYGLPIAIAQGTSTSADDLFQEASLGFAYDINAIQTVLIAK